MATRRKPAPKPESTEIKVETTKIEDGAITATNAAEAEKATEQGTGDEEAVEVLDVEDVQDGEIEIPEDSHRIRVTVEIDDEKYGFLYALSKEQIEKGGLVPVGVAADEAGRLVTNTIEDYFTERGVKLFR